jgi:exopolysaccharide biosynthesis polyprenyl glycosylphosphotransferase
VDIVFSAIILVATSPVMLLTALAVYLTAKGPIFYIQERMGLDGSRFKIFKFRTMKPDAEAGTGPVWAVDNDPRCTRLGTVLRRTSLDELPQFFNVLKGDMSIVGPRPERPNFVLEFKEKFPQYMLRHKVKSGITGWAQVNGWRGNTSIQKRIEHDLYYVENWSISFDLKIMWLTLWKGLMHRNAY